MVSGCMVTTSTAVLMIATTDSGGTEAIEKVAHRTETTPRIVPIHSDASGLGSEWPGKELASCHRPPKRARARGIAHMCTKDLATSRSLATALGTLIGAVSLFVRPPVLGREGYVWPFSECPSCLQRSLRRGHETYCSGDSILSVVR
jgi:hypothetical protein